MKLKAIETSYAGYRFRSRLEARWAVFFDHLGIRYDYEPEGYDLDGIWYLPDFWLLDHKVFIEIKPTFPSDEEIEKVALLSVASESDAYIFCGPIAAPECRLNGHGLYFQWDFEWTRTAYAFDSDHWWCECSVCGFLGIRFMGLSKELPCGHNDPLEANFSTPRLLSAYAAARSARFGR